MLDAIIRDLLTNPEFETIRCDYGAPRGRQIALDRSAGREVSWPKDYRPEVDGFTFVDADGMENAAKSKHRLLAMRLDKFRPDQKVSDPFDFPIEVVVYNAGGWDDGDLISGCRFYYTVERKGSEWIAVYPMLRS
jgi:hypothetical protein